MLGHDIHGTGPTTVVVLNDWLGDTSSWDPARPYLDAVRFRYVFTDLRGYGRSRGQRGELTIEEAAADVIALADALAATRFVIIGHSMSTLVALHLAQHFAARIARVVLVTPPPPAGFGADDATVAGLQRLAHGDDEVRLRGLGHVIGHELGEGFLRFKTARWREAADAEAVAGYVPMFARRGLPDRSIRVAAPVQAITGELDGPPMRSGAVRAALEPLCERLTIAALAEHGHYPMQEAPPRLAALVERFLLSEPASPTS